MNIVDIILIAIAVVFAAYGWRSGFVRAAGSLVAFVLCIVGSFYVMGWVHDTFGISFATQPWLTIVGFLVVLVVTNKIAGYLVDTLDLIRKAVAILPFVNLVNSTLGAVFGLLQVGSLIVVFSYLVVTIAPPGAFRDAAVASTIVSRTIDVETNAGIL